MSHSKRNTTRAVFTSYERDLAKSAWTSNSARLTRDSFLPFGSCYLCLEIARDPVSCGHGDIFCRECAVSNLLSQKKEIKRLARAREKAERDLREAMDREDEEAQKRAIKDFETIQAGLAPSLASSTSSPRPSSTQPPNEHEENASSTQAGKRKMVLDQEEVERIAKEDRAKARKTMDDETSKNRLPSFWTPSQTPGTDPLQNAVTQKPPKANPICPASPDDTQHTYSLKNIHAVKFAEESDPRNVETRRICPSCYKTLGNASRPMMARNCGHVLCRGCVVKFLAPVNIKGLQDEDTKESPPQGQTCFACDEKLVSTLGKDGSKEKSKRLSKEEIPGLIELRSEGTGFSARGPSRVEKQVTAFQC